MSYVHKMALGPARGLKGLAQAALVQAALLSVGCAVVGTGYSPTAGRPAAPSANTPAQIEELAAALEERASSRVQIGALRVLVEPFEEVESELPRHRHAILDAREAQAVVETLQYELTLSLGNRINVVDPGTVVEASASRAELRRATGATHAVVGTWYRAGDDVDVAARLVSLDDGWIVATAQLRIVDFEGRILSSTRARAVTPAAAWRTSRRPPRPKGGWWSWGSRPWLPQRRSRSRPLWGRRRRGRPTSRPKNSPGRARSPRPRTSPPTECPSTLTRAKCWVLVPRGLGPHACAARARRPAPRPTLVPARAGPAAAAGSSARA